MRKILVVALFFAFTVSAQAQDWMRLLPQPAGNQNYNVPPQAYHGQNDASNVVIPAKSRDGYIITSNHAAHGADDIEVRLAAGNPFGPENTLTHGILSAANTCLPPGVLIDGICIMPLKGGCGGFECTHGLVCMSDLSVHGAKEICCSPGQVNCDGVCVACSIAGGATLDVQTCGCGCPTGLESCLTASRSQYCSSLMENSDCGKCGNQCPEGSNCCPSVQGFGTSVGFTCTDPNDITSFHPETPIP
jgi:hypothetical protein